MSHVSDRRPTLDPADVLVAPQVSIDGALADIRELRAAAPVMPGATAASLDAKLPPDLPAEGVSLPDVLAELRDVVVAHARRNDHPGFYGYVCGSGAPTDPLAHAIVAELNQNVTSFGSAPGATTVERRLLRWLAAACGLPQGAEGLLTSGGSLANLSGIAAALRQALGSDFHARGLAGLGAAGVRPTLHRTAQAHFSIDRAALVLGVGREGLRTVEPDSELRMRPDLLDRSLTRAVEAGELPFCVVASAGTTTTGAIDPLEEIADVCQTHGVWLHVDGAYGAAAVLSPQLAGRMRGLGRADSISLDLHKWLFTAIDCSALLLRDPMRAKEAFFAQADYVQIPRDATDEQYAFFHHGPETSRRARALPAYVVLRHYGARRIGRNVEHGVRCAEYLAALVRDHPRLEALHDPHLSIFCFRYRPSEGTDGDALTEAIRERLVAEGDTYLSATRLGGRQVLRVCIVGHRTRAEHVELLVERVVAIGDELDGGTG